MSRQLGDLQNVLKQLIGEHRKLLVEIDRQQAAMKVLHIAEMESARASQEDIRRRVGTLENQRRSLTQQIATAMRKPQATLTEIAAAFPAEAKGYLALRDELREVIGRINHSNNVAGKLAGAVLGHLNTVSRILAGAMKPTGVYTKYGVPKVASRLGMIEAVG